MNELLLAVLALVGAVVAAAGGYLVGAGRLDDNDNDDNDHRSSPAAAVLVALVIDHDHDKAAGTAVNFIPPTLRNNGK